MSREEILQKLQDALLGVISEVPHTSEGKSDEPEKRARALTSTAALRAAMVSGGLAIPPGPLGLLTIVPDLIAIWRIQAQMVADIAGAYGKESFLGREQMLYCLFKHAGSQAVRDLVARVGERILIRRASLRALQNILRRVGIVVTQRVVGRTISRWIPLIGAGAIAAYAYYDTKKVGMTAIEFFSSDLEADPGEPIEPASPDQPPVKPERGQHS